MILLLLYSFWLFPAVIDGWQRRVEADRPIETPPAIHGRQRMTELEFDGLLPTLNEALAEALGIAAEDSDVAHRLTLMLAYAAGRASRLSRIDPGELIAAGRAHVD